MYIDKAELRKLRLNGIFTIDSNTYRLRVCSGVSDKTLNNIKTSVLNIIQNTDTQIELLMDKKFSPIQYEAQERFEIDRQLLKLSDELYTLKSIIRCIEDEIIVRKRTKIHDLINNDIYIDDIELKFNDIIHGLIGGVCL